MEMKQISESTLKITIPNDDLEERGMELADFLMPQEKTEDFFYSVLDELDLPDTFRESGMLSFRVTPKPDKLDIFVTKSNLDQDLDLADLADLAHVDDISEMTPEDFFKALEKNMRAKTQADAEAIDYLAQVDKEDAAHEAELDHQETSDFIYYILAFDRFLDLVRFIKNINFEVENSELYKMDNLYYLTVLINVAGHSALYPQHLLNRMLEHSDDIEISRPMLEEHGRNLIRVHAIEELSRISI